MSYSALGQSRSIRINGRRPSLRLEPVAWLSLFDIAEDEAMTPDELVERIAEEKSPERCLASAVRVFVGRLLATERASLMAYEQRSLRQDGQRRCLRLEPEFWRMLERIAQQEEQALPRLIDRINRRRQTRQGTGSALRCFVIRYFADRASKARHDVPKLSI